MNKSENKTEESKLFDPLPNFKALGEPYNEKGWERRTAEIPPLFRSNEPDRFPNSARRALELWEPVMRRAGEGRLRAKQKETYIRGSEAVGYVIAGPVGAGKTRLACLLALHYCASSWERPAFLSAVQIRAKAFSDWGAADKIIEAAAKPGILVFDDLGKGAPGNTVDEVVFSILDIRTAWNRPTIITTQYAPSALKTRFKEPETAEAIMRRIEQFSNPIVLV